MLVVGGGVSVICPDDCKHRVKREISSECRDCYRRDTLTDNYDPMDKEEMDKLQEKQQDEKPISLIDEIILLDSPENFLRVYRKAQRFTADAGAYGCYLTILAGQNHIRSCNGSILCQLNCDVPEALQGKVIVSIEDSGKASICTREELIFWGKTNSKIEEILTPQKEFPLMSIEAKAVVSLDGEKYYAIYFPDHTPTVKNELYNEALDVLGYDGVSIGYAEGHVSIVEIPPVTLRSALGTCSILPLRSLACYAPCDQCGRDEIDLCKHSRESLSGSIIFAKDRMLPICPGYWAKEGQLGGVVDQSRLSADMMAGDFGRLLHEEREKNYGTDMAALVKMIEDGKFW